MATGVPGWPAGAGVLGVAAVARLLDLHPQTVWRWIRFGVEVGGGGVLKLEALKTGSRYKIGEADLLAFLHAYQGGGPGEDALAEQRAAVEATRPRR